MRKLLISVLFICGSQIDQSWGMQGDGAGYVDNRNPYAYYEVDKWGWDYWGVTGLDVPPPNAHEAAGVSPAPRAQENPVKILFNDDTTEG